MLHPLYSLSGQRFPTIFQSHVRRPPTTKFHAELLINFSNKAGKCIAKFSHTLPAKIYTDFSPYFVYEESCFIEWTPLNIYSKSFIALASCLVDSEDPKH